MRKRRVAPLTDGCEQRERFPAGLEKDRFRVDEMSFETLVATTADLASHLAFFDLQELPQDTWGGMFEVDEALVIARIISTDPAALQAMHQGHDALNLALRVMALAQQVDAWYNALDAGEILASRRLRTRIEQLVKQSLAADWRWVRAHLSTQLQSEVVVKALKPLHPIWLPADGSINTRNVDLKFLRGRLASFTAAIEEVQALAREVLPVSLNTQTHAPAAGLLMGFLQMFNVVQARINRFTDRHADFYYDECLRMTPLGTVPDRLHLVFERDRRAKREVVIARGTTFTAGKDSAGHLIEFRADERLLVTDARVVSLLTLRQDRDPDISPEHEFGYVTRSEAMRLDWPPTSIPAADTAPPHWPMFGGARMSASRAPATPARDITVNNLEDTRLGVAIASPLLLLGEGQRTITLTLGLMQPAEADEQSRVLSARMFTLTARVLKLTQADGQLPDAAAGLKAGVTAQKRIRLKVRKRALIKARDRVVVQIWERYLQLMPELLSATEAKPNGFAKKLFNKSRSRHVRTPEVVDTNEALTHYERFITELTIQAPTEELFYKRLGRLFTRWLLARGDWLGDQALKDLRASAERWLRPQHRRTAPVAGDPRCLIYGADNVRPACALICSQYFNSFFDFSLSTPTGWTVVSNVVVRPVEAGAESASPSLQVVLTLSPDDPPVTGCVAALHGAGLTTELPVLRIQMHGHGRIYPYSLLADLRLTDVKLNVQVQGVRDLVLYNQIGRLDASKPFMPFGPLPTTSSYLAFGAAELACKQITKLRVNVEWSALPLDDRGFASYYADYGDDSNTLRNESFTAMPGILRNGQWQPGGLPTQRLFESLDARGRIKPISSLGFDELALRTHDRALPEALDFSGSRPSGFYRLQLTGPVGAFGHLAYPGLLTKAVTANASQRRKRPLALPNAPYTPHVERVSLDYEAQSHMLLPSEASANDMPATERVWQLHPFGAEQIYPGQYRSSPTLLPRVDHDGNLFIGIAATDLQGSLTLHFQMRGEDAAAREARKPAPQISWAYLASNDWHDLRPEQVITNTTSGFLTSGIVTLDLPAEINRNNTILSADCYWLRVSVDTELETFASLCGVRAQALHATRVIGGKFAAPATLPSGSVTEPAATIVGLSAVAQIGPSFGLRPAEDRRQMQTRIGERLQHRQRASTPWDYERLVLERFPVVLKVKCFPGMSRSEKPASPANVLVVVVPRPHPEPATADDADETSATPIASAIVSATAAPHLNAKELLDITAYLGSLASPFARIEVCNATYERIQVRCTVKRVAGSQPGQTLRRVNRAIVEVISPWREPGYKLNFDWTVRCEDIEAHVRSLDCVDSVTQISLLHVTQSDRGYALGDTARIRDTVMASDTTRVSSANHVRPVSPWSIVLPMDEHIVTLVEKSTEAPPEATGIARLRIGNTFILG